MPLPISFLPVIPPPFVLCPQWLPDTLMQAIASENNLSETAFFVKQGDAFDIRWFTPKIEVALCGHATLASAYVLFEQLNYHGDVIKFQSKSGPLQVEKKEDLFQLNFPRLITEAIEPDNAMFRCASVYFQLSIIEVVTIISLY